MKAITEKQCEAILSDLLNLNVPSQFYIGMQKLFNSLPDVDEKHVEGKENPKKDA